MGKSTLSNMLRFLGIPVHDADEEVARLLSEDSDTRQAIEVLFPPRSHAQIYTGQGINRKELGRLVFDHEERRRKLESILHPNVHRAQGRFILKHRKAGRPLVVLDIPLLFETGRDVDVDAIITASAPAHIQRQRVLSRPGMDAQKFRGIVQSQLPDGEKRARADYIVDTGIGRAHAMRQLQEIVQDLPQQNESLLDKKPGEKYYLYG